VKTNITVPDEYAAMAIAVTLGINVAIGGDDPCTVALSIALASNRLFHQNNSNPYFAMTVYRHDRAFRVDTCRYALQVNNA